MQPGDAVRVELTKWGDRPHWAFDAVFAGRDEHGDWVGIPGGTTISRPGATVVTQTDQVSLFPRAGRAADAWIATFHAPGADVTTYVDMTTAPVWERADGVPVCRAVDLDLDVIRPATGEVYVDDEDEFAEPRAAYGYPADVVALAEEACRWVLAAVVARQAPFDDRTAERWLATVTGGSGVVRTTPEPPIAASG